MTTMSSTPAPTTKTQPNRPKVGVAVFIVRPVKPSAATSTSTTTTPNQALNTSALEFVIGERLGSHGANTWALPGGHLELNESIEECASREVLEETGLPVKNVRFLTATNDVMHSEDKHYITLFVVAEVDDDDDETSRPEPQLLEPNKCAGWEWITWDTLVGWVDGEVGGDVRRLFLPMINLVRTRPGVMPLLL